MKKKILFICGSLNQTTMMHQIAAHLDDADCFYTPYYTDGFLDILVRNGLLDFTILGGNARHMTENYLNERQLPIDYHGNSYDYDLVVTCSDLIIPKNIRSKPVVLVQEGMTDPENIMFHLVKWLKLPRYLASTSTTGLSDAYTVFCVASEGYRDLFVQKGVQPEKLIVTGIPNFDNCCRYLDNDFPHRNYVLVATSDMRETFKYENRKKFIAYCTAIAAGRPLIFKLHPNEEVERATQEIRECAPGALVFSSGNTNHMIANCEVLITRFSSVVYVGLALGREVYSDFELDRLKQLVPLQNGGASAGNIASVCRRLLEQNVRPVSPSPQHRQRPVFPSFRQKPVPTFSLFSRKFGAW